MWCIWWVWRHTLWRTSHLKATSLIIYSPHKNCSFYPHRKDVQRYSIVGKIMFKDWTTSYSCGLLILTFSCHKSLSCPLQYCLLSYTVGIDFMHTYSFKSEMHLYPPWFFPFEISFDIKFFPRMVMPIEKWIGKRTTNIVAQNVAFSTVVNNWVWFDFKVVITLAATLFNVWVTFYLGSILFI